MSRVQTVSRKATGLSKTDSDEKLGALADAARSAADRASDSLDDVLSFVAASEKRIAAMEAKLQTAQGFIYQKLDDETK
ncbi:hypothetical protein [Actimicrobium sp. CCI2.3]|uniref:hypothetical protein n=1 Tax=Actimicrobium sp. CCI2.3 TaxID=3048616 RepID=UPI002B24BB55|nr:hypothetical protein [Actimicrobium sp. CCI2.3]MEB0023799.1 hypothetical protein [Actimicrobium sp. CCI2.3]